MFGDRLHIILQRRNMTMWDIFIVVILVFLSGVAFGLGTMLIMDFYYNKQFMKWKKEQEEDDDR